jgi:uncharacterized protein
VSPLPEPSAEDVAAVTAMLGRPPAGEFRVAVRRFNGAPMVIENDPHLRDGTPMPTLYWLVDPELREAVSRIEGRDGVHRYEALVNADALADAHQRYAALRDLIIKRPDLPAPSGGVGGTATGVKCLHAHVAFVLAGHADPVGELVLEELVIPPHVNEAAG